MTGNRRRRLQKFRLLNFHGGDIKKITQAHGKDARKPLRRPRWGKTRESMKKKAIVLVFLTLFLAVALFVYVAKEKNAGDELYFSGTIEATNSQLAFQVRGIVTAVHVSEGQAAKQGDLLAELDRSEFEAALAQAEANVETARKNLTRIETTLDMLQETLPADVERARAGVASAQAAFTEAARNRERYDVLFRKNVVSQQEWDAVRLNFETAEARLVEARAVLRQAESGLKKLETVSEEKKVAEAQVRALEASRKLAEIQKDHGSLTAPYNGIVTSRNVEPGEVITPGQEVLTLSDLSRVDLKIYVGETNIGKVYPGQPVDVRIDTFPDRVFRGTVSYVSPEGEFTPKIIQTHKERVKLVYLVKVSIPNGGLELKTGMPADAWLR